MQVFELKVLSALSLRRLKGLRREDIEAHIGMHKDYRGSIEVMCTAKEASQ